MNQYNWLKKNTIAMWPFDGDLYDASPNGYDLEDSPDSYAIGKFGQCAKFTGIEGCTRLLDPSDPMLDTTFSVDVWINTADDWSLGTITSLSEFFDYSGCWGWILQIEEGVIVFGSADAYSDWDLVYGNTNVADSEWHRIVLTAGTNIKIYIDGLLDKSSAGSSVAFPGGYPIALSVGMMYNYNTNYWDDGFIGQLNCLEILNSIKSPQEIQRDYAFQMGWI